MVTPGASLAAVEIPTLILCGGASHPAVRRANALLSEFMRRAAFVLVEGASHFMISTHAIQVSWLIVEQCGGLIPNRFDCLAT
jgi:pimeloyl-ACP methyl ester carboxylesterase